MNREQKKVAVSQYKEFFNNFGTVILVEYTGLSVSNFKTLRSALNDNGRVTVVKNKLAKIALVDSKFSSLTNEFNGQIAVAYSNNPIELAKALVGFAEKNEALKLKVGFMDGEALDSKKIVALSKLPSLDELRAKLVGVIAAPARNIACIINAVPSSVARVIKAKNQ